MIVLTILNNEVIALAAIDPSVGPVSTCGVLLPEVGVTVEFCATNTATVLECAMVFKYSNSCPAIVLVPFNQNVLPWYMLAVFEP